MHVSYMPVHFTSPRTLRAQQSCAFRNSAFRRQPCSIASRLMVLRSAAFQAHFRLKAHTRRAKPSRASNMQPAMSEYRRAAPLSQPSHPLRARKLCYSIQSRTPPKKESVFNSMSGIPEQSRRELLSARPRNRSTIAPKDKGDFMSDLSVNTRATIVFSTFAAVMICCPQPVSARSCIGREVTTTDVSTIYVRNRVFERTIVTEVAVNFVGRKWAKTFPNSGGLYQTFRLDQDPETTLALFSD